MSIDIFKQTGARLGRRATRPVRDGIGQPAVGGGLDLIGVATGQAVGTGLEDVVTKIAGYQAKLNEKEEEQRIRNKNTTEAARLEKRLQLKMDEWKSDENFSTWTPEEFTNKWNAYEKQELNNLKNIIFKNDERAFARFESAYYTIFNNNRRVFRKERQDKILYDGMFNLNRAKTARSNSYASISTTTLDTPKIWKEIYESGARDIKAEGDQENALNGNKTINDVNAEIDLFEFNLWKQVLSRATMFTKKNPFYDEQKAIELGDQYTESEYITDWDKVKSWLEGDKEYAGKKMNPTFVDGLKDYAFKEGDRQEQTLKDKKIKIETALYKDYFEQIIRYEGDTQNYITEETIENSNLEPKLKEDLISLRNDYIQGRIVIDAALELEVWNKLYKGEITSFYNQDFTVKDPNSAGQSRKENSIATAKFISLETKQKMERYLENKKKNPSLANSEKTAYNEFETWIKKKKEEIHGRRGDNTYGNSYYYQIRLKYFQKFTEGLEAGKSWQQLLTASSQDYIGNTIQDDKVKDNGNSFFNKSLGLNQRKEVTDIDVGQDDSKIPIINTPEELKQYIKDNPNATKFMDSNGTIRDIK